MKTAQKYSISDFINVCHSIARQKGWWDRERNDAEIIALLHSELSEALEALRNNEPPERIAEELADCLIRIFDYCGGRNLDLEKALLEKIKKNRKRPYRHGNKKY